MDITVSQSSLHHALRVASRAVPARPVLPVLQHFVLEAGPAGLTVTATDTEVAIVSTTAAEATAPGRIAVTARLLDDFVAQLPSESVRLSLAKDRPRLEVRCGRFSAGFATADAGEFPALPDVTGGTALDLDATRLRDALQRVVFAAARDEQRPVLATVLVRSAPAGLVLAAADGFRLARVRLPGSGLPECEALVPARGAAEMGRQLADAESAELVFAPGGRSLRLSTKNATLYVRLAEGTFPDLDRVIPTATGARITVETAALRRAVAAVSLFGGSAAGRPVRLEAGDGRLQLRAQAAETGDAETDVPAHINGGAQVVTLSTPLLADVLGVATAQQVQLDVNGPGAPVVLREAGEAGDTGSLWVVMPLLTAERPLAAPPARAAEQATAGTPAAAGAAPATEPPAQPVALPRAA
jgi:DNA polymerase III subunit beta